MRYRDFHTAYKKMELAPDELIRAVCLPRQFAGYVSYTRKVGHSQRASDRKGVRRGAGPARKWSYCRRADRNWKRCAGAASFGRDGTNFDGRRIEPTLVELARKTAAAEILPIDDIRSTARYRSAVAGNLVAEFLEQARRGRAERMSEVLARWNRLPARRGGV